ncbi:MAG: polyprenyl synthetase family protein, partial [Deltaproteobacteria bacterium]|nr:polyprenyl synthetase family protein [Deltaproteobacteria bacterium]
GMLEINQDIQNSHQQVLQDAYVKSLLEEVPRQNFSVEAKLKHYQAIIEKSWQTLKTLAMPQKMQEAFDHVLLQKGKRLRPLLVILAGELFEMPIEKSLVPALALETFHNSTLVHDDIMDEAELRRGQATVHHQWDEATAILIGDIYLTKTYSLLTHLESKHIARSISLFNEVVEKIIQGQFLDLQFETQSDVLLEDYLLMIENKTALLLAIALKLGALNAGASLSDQEHLYEFGKKMGMAFQIQDDFLDCFGNKQSFGKKVGGDIIQNKKTFIILKAMEIADATTQQKLKKLLSEKTKQPEKKVLQVQSILKDLKIDLMSQEAQKRYFDEALWHLSAVPVPEKRKLPLTFLAQSLLKREH